MLFVWRRTKHLGLWADDYPRLTCGMVGFLFFFLNNFFVCFKIAFFFSFIIVCFKMAFNLVITLFLFYVFIYLFFALLCSMWDLNFPTRD